MTKRVVIFDLDETVVDSSHRTPNNPDGTLNLARYFELKNRDSIMQDSLLPLARVMQSLCRSDNFVVICTARAMNQDDYDFLAANQIDAHLVLCRPLDGSENHLNDGVLKATKLSQLQSDPRFAGKPFVMFDDSKPVIRAMRAIGIACLNAVKVNRRLRA